MSFQKDDRNIRLTNLEYETAIAAALRAAFGDSRSAIKVVARMTGANERAVRNWFEGRNGPSGSHLISLIRHSDPVLITVLSLSGRGGLMNRLHIDAICGELRALLDRLEGWRAYEGPGELHLGSPE